MKKVLHYKTNFLNPSETFIHRFVSNHQTFTPVALCYTKKSFSDHLELFEVPKTGVSALLNQLTFHLNITLPFYKKTIREVRPDIIHAHFGYDGYKLLSASRQHAIPMVISFYGSDVSRLPDEFGWRRRYRKMAASHARFVAASIFMKRQLIDLGFPEDRIEVIRFGFDTSQIPFNTEYQMNKPIILVGRLVEKKGFRFALEAIQLLKRRGVTVQANIFGDGPLFQELNDLSAQLGIANQIHFKGFHPIEDILHEFRHHSLLLAPSVRAGDGDMEGLPNTILEAMASGTPVVTTRHAAIPEAVMDGKTGFLADERRPDQLADIMERFYAEHYDTHGIRVNARALIEREYDIQKNVMQTEALYNSLIKAGF